MRNLKIVIADLTCTPSRIGVTAAASANIEFVEGSETMWHVALRDAANGLLTLTGEEAAALEDDNSAIVFDDVIHDLPGIEDQELQAHLMRACWDALCQRLRQQSLLTDDDKAVCYLILPGFYPPSLLERWRAVCGDGNAIKLAGFIHESAALLLGFLHSNLFAQARQDQTLSSRGRICLIHALDDSEAEVAHFDYEVESGRCPRLLIHDHLHTMCAGLPARLMDCDWLGDLSAVILVEAASLNGRSREALDHILRVLSTSACRFRPTNRPDLKLRGAVQIARCAIGRGDLTNEFIIETAYHIGLRINQSHLHPIINRQQFAAITDFPHTAFQAFNLKGQPGNQLRLNLYCGQSNLVGDAIFLGHLTLAGGLPEMLSRSANALLAAAVRLDSPGSGEVIFGLLPEDKIVGSVPFKLPGLVI